MSRITHRLPIGHELLAAVAIGALSALLAAGLGVLGLLGALNGTISRWVGHATPRSLPVWLPWLAAVVFAFALALAILSVPGTWRRLVLWITAVVLVAAWAPVLGLAAHAPEIAAPLVATLWSGVCAVVYARNHHMASDRQPVPTDAPHEAR